MSHSNTQCKSFICQIRHGSYSLQKKSAGCKITKYLWGLLWGCIFFFLPETWIHLSKNMFIFPFSLKHIYFLQEINREKKKVWVREVCNKPGFSHQLWNIMTIFDGYDLLGFRNHVNLFSQRVWGKYSYHEGVCIFCSLLHFAIWAGFVLTWYNGKCCAIQARAGVLKGDFCIILIRERENISM